MSCAATLNTGMSMPFSLPTGSRPGFTLQGSPGVPGMAQLPCHSPCLLRSLGWSQGHAGGASLWAMRFLPAPTPRQHRPAQHLTRVRGREEWWQEEHCSSSEVGGHMRDTAAEVGTIPHPPTPSRLVSSHGKGVFEGLVPISRLLTDPV